MPASLFKGCIILVLSIICCFSLHGQLPASNLIYMRSPTGTDIYNYDPSQPVSATNPSVNTIELPAPPGHGLAICEVLGAGNSILTFYTILDDKYWYYDPFSATWVNTHHKTASGGVAVNFGGGGGFIFNFDAIGGNVFRYDGTGDGTLLLHIPGYSSTAGVADVVVDCDGNWYIMQLFPGNNSNSYLRKYNSAGTLLQTWSINNPNNFSSGPGFGIVDNTIYLINQITNPAGLSIPSASLGTSTIDFSTNPPLLPISTLNDDMGSVPASGTGTIVPTVDISTADNPVCPQTPVTFTSVISNGGVNPDYQWFVNGLPVAGATNPTFSFAPENEDIVTCQLTTAAQNCSSKAAVLSNAVVMYVLEPVIPVLHYNTAVFCKDAVPSAPIFSPAGGTFSVNAQGLAIDVNTGAIDPAVSTPGTYIITYMPVTTTGCKQDSVQDSVTIVPLPEAQINRIGIPDELCLNESFALSAIQQPGCIYQWQPADYFPDGNTGIKVTAKAISSGVIYLTVINSSGCMNTDDVSLKAKACCNVFLPNAFSPDNDGLNDVFKMYSKSDMQQAVSFTIYNRWGQKVFFTSNQLSGWDGMYNNQPADAGIYFYTLNYTCSDGTEKAMKGEVTLIR